MQQRSTCSIKRIATALAPLLVQSAMAITMGNITVGSSTIELEDSARSRKLTSEMWYPAEPGAQVQSFSPLPPLAGIDVARQASPEANVGRRPLIVVSHGNWGTRFSQGWFNREMVKAGFVVLSVSHPGTMNEDQTAAGRLRIWDRARDVSTALDAVLANPQWSSLIDTNRIGFAGHSFGGFTGVSLAGGRFDLQRQRSACSNMVSKDLYCQGLLTEDYSKVSIANMSDSYLDKRFKAFYIMATGPAQGFTPESLASIQAPFMVDTAKFDTVLEAKSNSSALARQIAGATEIVREAGHFDYVPLCRPLVGKLLAPIICTNTPGVERSAVHVSAAMAAQKFFTTTFPVAKPGN